MTLACALFLLGALQAKHLIFDFLLQPRYIYRNKGIYGHPGGILHAGLHGGATLCVLLLFDVTAIRALMISLAEAVFHYHVDWAKEKLSSRCGLRPERSGFWFLLGTDQAVHQWTYVVILAVAG